MPPRRRRRAPRMRCRGPRRCTASPTGCAAWPRTGSTRATTASPPTPWRRPTPAPIAAALRRAAAAALSDLLHGRVRDLPGRVDLRRDTAALPLGPWMAELGTAAEPAAVIDRAALLPPEAAALKRALAAARARAAAGGLPARAADAGQRRAGARRHRPGPGAGAARPAGRDRPGRRRAAPGRPGRYSTRTSSPRSAASRRPRGWSRMAAPAA